MEHCSDLLFYCNKWLIHLFTDTYAAHNLHYMTLSEAEEQNAAEGLQYFPWEGDDWLGVIEK